MAGALRGSFWRNTVEQVGSYLPEPNFISLHYLYFLGTCIVTSVIFYCSSTPAWSITYTDSLFLVVSAMTEAGLNTVNLSQMNTFQQVLLWLHIVGGSAIFVSIFVVLLRKRTFEKRFGILLKEQHLQRRNRRGTISDASCWNFLYFKNLFLPGPTTPLTGIGKDAEKPFNGQSQSSNGTDTNGLRTDTAGASEFPGNTETAVESPTTKEISQACHEDFQKAKSIEKSRRNSDRSSADHITFVRETSFTPNNSQGQTSRMKRRNSAFSLTGVGASPATTSFRRPFFSELNENQRNITTIGRGLMHDPTTPRHVVDLLRREVVGRNSQFHGLTDEERAQLGSVEYRAVQLLSWVVPLYFVLWQLLGSLAVGAWMNNYAADITRANGINPWWTGIFFAVSAFNNSGMSLLDANMIPFQQSTFPVFTMGLLILAGNTAYPVFLRLILWTMYRLYPDTPYYREWRETLKFTLDHPRRVYTNLFPSMQSWWLAATLVILNGTDWLAFEVLNVGNLAVSEIPPRSRVLDGLFQALAVRSGGFYIVPIASLRIGVQVLYVLMMYISVYPVVITMRNSNVYEERSLGIYADDPVENKNETDPEIGAISRLRRRITGFKRPSETRSYFVRQQVRGQLAHDLSWLAIAVLLIVCIENSSFESEPITFSVFNVVFEVVSGYGCVGITTGLSTEAYSFSGAWHVVSKLILCAVMLRGRHRGLPVAIDRAVLLPGENLQRKEDEDHELRKGKSIELRERQD